MKPIFSPVVSAFAALLACAANVSAGPTNGPDFSKLQTPIYRVDGTSFVRDNGGRLNNRPLYGNQVYYVTLAGDRPMLRVGGANIHNGVFMLAYVRGESAMWLHDFGQVTSRYNAGHMQWSIADSRFNGVTLNLQAVPTAVGMSSAVRLNVQGAAPGDRIVWAFGGASQTERQAFLWDWCITTFGRDALMERGFEPDLCVQDDVNIQQQTLRIASPPHKEPRASAVRCSVESELKIGDAEAWKNPLQLIQSNPGERPLGFGIIPADVAQPIDWLIVTQNSDRSDAEIGSPADISSAFDAGVQRVTSVRERVAVDTPDDSLDAAIAASGHVIDGIFRSSVYTHSGMRWGVPLIGWRSIYGATAYGWHDRVLEQARLCLSRQITESDKTQPVADPKKKLASQAPESRLFGKGRVAAFHGNHYDMQTQFFDQLIDSWRASPNPELETILRPALELHLEYIRECFDPDDDGLYESYTNTWPTDGMWYSGGATSEQTAYAYNAHRAAMQLAQRAGDLANAQNHAARMQKIRDAFNQKLWLAERGHPAAYIEQTGLQRPHAAYWLYHIFVPVEARLLDSVQAVQSLRHTEHDLERVKMPYGGEQCWPSNWVPSVWSVRQMWPGDNYALAQAYLETGLTEKGWSLLRGTFPESLLYGPVPGDLGYPAGGADFSDCVSPFGRIVVRGLFGYRPDYPANLVTIAPQFPHEWNHASMRTPDCSIDFRRIDNTDRIEIQLTHPAPIELILPIHAAAIDSVRVNGEAVSPTISAGFGKALATIRIDAPSNHVVVEMTLNERLAPVPAVEIESQVNAPLVLKSDAGKIISALDPQHAIASTKPDNGVITTRTNNSAGHRTILTTVQRGKLELIQLVHLSTRNAAAEAEQQHLNLREAPADAAWKPIDLTPALNADVRTIYQQEYLSPRPNTVSLRMGIDGYSSWQMALDPKIKPPEIKLDRVPDMIDNDRLLRASNGAKFTPPDTQGNHNIAFVSQWDNWPRSSSFDVNQQGDAIFFLIVGTTNPMQVRIANATLRLIYADGVEQTIDLVPPFNFWTLCHINRADYNLKRDAFAIGTPPPLVQLGENCRGTVVGHRLRPGVALKSVTLDAKSPEVVVGVMAASIMNPK